MLHIFSVKTTETVTEPIMSMGSVVRCQCLSLNESIFLFLERNEKTENLNSRGDFVVWLKSHLKTACGFTPI